VQGRLPTTLTAAGIAAPDVAALAAAAAGQRTGGFNPRPVDASALAGLYEAAR
jgi:alcohol dehydrogenase class IV